MDSAPWGVAGEGAVRCVVIKRIELTNFMSHEHTVLEPAEGLTVLVGPNNCGKSAVVVALQSLAHNKHANYVVRHGEKECTVRVETDDGHVVEWRRKSSSSRYTIDGQVYDRLGRNGTPDTLDQTLRLAYVASGDMDADVHFGDQKQPIFLLDSSESKAAQFFASSSDAGRFVEMQALHKQKTATAQKDKVRLEAEAAQLNRELETLEPVAELDEGLRLLENVHAELCDLARCIGEHEAILGQLQARMLQRARLNAQAEALSTLPEAPVLQAEPPLVSLCQELRKVDRSARRSAAGAAALKELSPPPAMQPTEPLESLARDLSQAALASRRAKGVADSLTALEAPPLLRDAASLQRMVASLTSLKHGLDHQARLGSALLPLEPPPAVAEQQAAMSRLKEHLALLWSSLARVEDSRRNASAAATQLIEAESRTAQWASQKQVCSACGSPLDPQRLVQRITGLEGTYP